MALKFNILFILSCLIHPTVCAQTLIKVLIEEISTEGEGSWELESKHGLKSELFESTNKKPASKIKIFIRNGQIYYNGKQIKHPKVLIKPINGPIAVNSNFYDGDFIIYKTANRILLINRVELESYISSVLKTESWPGWPKEVNKVFAVASRSYVLAQVLTARKTKSPYHIRNTNHHQTYSGIHDQADIKEAVLETKGMILTYNGEPILAMFDCCCGGVVPANMDGIDFVSHPYLARTERCLHCQPFKIYSWQASYTDQDFKKILQTVIPHVHSIRKVSIKTDKAGTVKNLLVHSGRNIHTVNARTIYSLFKEIKSFCYSINQKSNTVHVNGTGFGHHLGLCQWGARKMVEKGHNYREILHFYYPKTKFTKFKG